MKSLIFGLALLLLPFSAFSQSQQPGPLEVVQNQLEALASENWELAYGYAAPEVRLMFRSPEVFKRMVNQGYAYMLEPQDAQLTLVERSEEAALIEAIFVSQKNQVNRVAYSLRLLPNGQWLIAGVIALTSMDAAA